MPAAAQSPHQARCVIDEDRGSFREAALGTGMISHVKRFDFDNYWRMLRHQYAPYCTSRDRFSRAYLEAGLEFSGPGNPNLRRLAIPPP